ncbi:MAG TPA: HAMP domain-containing sensor histidine kinase [Acidimicrobiales bacterium]|nr:HAMP domain-containing sensor histidine kinase [Acidimicrobiales bacterium]
MADPGRRLTAVQPSPWFGSVRVRITLSALVVVAVTLALGGASLVWLLHRSLVHGLVSRATAEAEDVSSLVTTGSVPGRLPVRSGVAVQVVDGKGGVLAASPDLVGRGPVTTRRPPVGVTQQLPTNRVLPGEDDADLMVATTVATPRGPLTVYALVSDDPAESSVHTLSFVLLVVLPLLLVGAGVFAWFLAGRALRPVEAIRREVGDISGGDLHHRVPEPPYYDEIGRLARTMNEMLARLEAASAQQRRFVSNASHELRSPLAALVAQLEVAQAHPESADWPEVAEAVTEEAERLWRLVDDLLLLARGDEGHLVPGHDPVDLDEIVLAEGARLRAQRRVAVDLHRVGAARVEGDREQLRRVVRNLTDNAERHAAHQVSFELRPVGGWVELVVADDGPGIPEAERDRVFERFARLDEARDRPDGGTGLGLAIVGAVVEAHGGTADVADSETGTRMVVRLPAARSSLPAPAPPVVIR